MLSIILTLDYEIHGNGDGSPRALMVEPTYRLLRLCDEYGAKLTIMADIAEILKFREYRDTFGRDDYCYGDIVEQLRRAIKTGHDVQLHIHSSYFNARHENSRWLQDWSEYNFAELPYERMDWMVRHCKAFLETLLTSADPTYRCVAFRAANWAVNPSQQIVPILINNGISLDSSVFKYGRRDGLVTFDYSQAHSPIVPWRARADDICRPDDTSRLWEVPIYSENRRIGVFLTSGRIRRVLTSWSHKVRGAADSDVPQRAHEPQAPRALWRYLLQRQAWKADFNQCTGRQLIAALRRASKRYGSHKGVLPFVLIGHSKLFTEGNSRTLRPFLAHCAQHTDQFRFDRISSVDLEAGAWTVAA